MIISDKFVIGHIPKTGGHALAVMLSKVPNLEFQSPFRIENGRAKIFEKGVTLHRSFDDLAREELVNKDLLLVIRKLPDWYYSILWHHGIHTKVNEKRGVSKHRVRDVYDNDFINKVPPVILMPEITCKTTYPDFKLQEIKGTIPTSRIYWLRQEYLADDLINYLKIEDPFVTTNIKAIQKYRHSYKTHIPKQRYYSERDIEILYSNNPLWTSIEQELY